MAAAMMLGFWPRTVSAQAREGNSLVSLYHYGEQNGDLLMRDHDIVFMFHEHARETFAEPVSFRNDYMALCQEVYKYDEDGKRTHVAPRLKRELKDFSRTWFENLRVQGYFSADVIREILS